jgi:hypothetical protein
VRVIALGMTTLLRPLAALCLSAALLSGCVPEADTLPRLHDIALYSNASDLHGVYSYFYGNPMTLRVGADSVTLTEGRSSDPLAVPSALLVDGQPYLKRAVQRLSPPPSRVQRIPLTSDVQLEVGAGGVAQEVLYFDGSQWFTLAQNPAPSLGQRVTPTVRLGGLRGLGNLTPEEADRIAAVLTERAPVAVTLLPEDRVSPRRTDGLGEYRRTALYVQQTLPTDAGAFVPPAQDLIWEPIASGTQAAGAQTVQFALITNTDELAAAWNRAHGSLLAIPPLPDIDFRREVVVAIFSDTKPSGGYDLRVTGATLEGRDLYLDLQQIAPPADAITTQALTTPWLMLRVLREGITAAWVRDATTGQLIGVAQRQ